jgi:Flp pilus assembly protein TadG
LARDSFPYIVYQFGGDAQRGQLVLNKFGSKTHENPPDRGWMRRLAMKKGVDMHKLFRLAREEHGAALLEFAWTLVALIVLLFGVFQWGYAMYAYHFTTYAAQQGARFAMVRGGTWSKNVFSPCGTSAPPNFTMAYDCTALSSDIQNFVQSLATGGINPNNITVNSDNWPGSTPDGATCLTTNSQGCLVKVTVSYNFTLLPFMPKSALSVRPMSALSMSATSEKVIVQ